MYPNPNLKSKKSEFLDYLDLWSWIFIISSWLRYVQSLKTCNDLVVSMLTSIPSPLHIQTLTFDLENQSCPSSLYWWQVYKTDYDNHNGCVSNVFPLHDESWDKFHWSGLHSIKNVLDRQVHKGCDGTFTVNCSQTNFAPVLYSPSDLRAN